MSDLRDLPLREFRPVPMVRREPTPLSEQPPFPIVDAHNHLGRWLTGDWSVPDVDALLASMDDWGVEAIVNLDGMWGDELEANLDRYDRAHPGRFMTFAQWDRELFARDDWAGLAAQMADSARRGARGLKVWKDLGLHLRDGAGALVMPDDARLDPVWDAVADGRDPRDDPRRGPRRVLRAAGRAQRAGRGAARQSRLVVRRSRPVPAVRRDHRVARGVDRPAQRRHVDRRARAVLRRGRGVGRAHARHLSERVRRHRRADRRARAGAARHARADRSPSRPVPVRHGRIPTRPARCTRCTAGSSRQPTSSSRTTPIRTRCPARPVDDQRSRSPAGSARAASTGRTRGVSCGHDRSDRSWSGRFGSDQSRWRMLVCDASAPSSGHAAASIQTRTRREAVHGRVLPRCPSKLSSGSLRSTASASVERRSTEVARSLRRTTAVPRADPSRPGPRARPISSAGRSPHRRRDDAPPPSRVGPLERGARSSHPSERLGTRRDASSAREHRCGCARRTTVCRRPTSSPTSRRRISRDDGRAEADLGLATADARTTDRRREPEVERPLGDRRNES